MEKIYIVVSFWQKPRLDNWKGFGFSLMTETAPLGWAELGPEQAASCHYLAGCWAANFSFLPQQTWHSNGSRSCSISSAARSLFILRGSFWLRFSHRHWNESAPSPSIQHTSDKHSFHLWLPRDGFERSRHNKACLLPCMLVNPLQLSGKTDF